MKKIILITLALISILLFPQITIPIIIIYMLYILFKKYSKLNKNYLNKFKLLLDSILNKEYRAIYFVNKYDLYQVNKNVHILKIDNRWMFFLFLEAIGDLKEFPSYMQDVYFIFSNGRKLIVIKEEAYAFKLTKNILKSKLSSLAGKLEAVKGFLETNGCSARILDTNPIW